MFSWVEYEISCITSCMSFACFTFTYLQDKMLRVLVQERKEGKTNLRWRLVVKMVHNMFTTVSKLSLSSGPVLRHLNESFITTTEINLGYFITSPLLRIQSKQTVWILIRQRFMWSSICQIVWILIRLRFLWRLICVCTVCLCPIKGTHYLDSIFLPVWPSSKIAIKSIASSPGAAK